MARKADASIAFSLTDNLSQSVARMRTAVDGFEQDVDGLQKKLDLLQNTKMQLKQVDLKNAKQQGAAYLADAAKDAAGSGMSGVEGEPGGGEKPDEFLDALKAMGKKQQ